MSLSLGQPVPSEVFLLPYSDPSPFSCMHVYHQLSACRVPYLESSLRRCHNNKPRLCSADVGHVGTGAREQFGIRHGASSVLVEWPGLRLGSTESFVLLVVMQILCSCLCM